MRPSIVIALIAAACAATAPAALADSTNSSNWAGYAVHKPGVLFHTVSGTWRQPDAKCTPGAQSYSAFWVGLGGFSLNAPALEQTGTEVDCSISGKVVSTAWYELVPAASVPIRLTVHPGDLMRARVTVTGRQVVISLDDVTRHTGFKKTLNANVIDVSSAEWIAEAPSQCVSIDSCQTLPLADFAPTKFDSATVKSSAGHSGSIADRAWSFTKINLTPGGRRIDLVTDIGRPVVLGQLGTCLGAGQSVQPGSPRSGPRRRRSLPLGARLRARRDGG